MISSVTALIPYLPQPNPPAPRCHLRLSPPYSISKTATSAVTTNIGTTTAITTPTTTVTTTPVDRKNGLMVNYLIDSLGFSRDEAIYALAQVRPSKSLTQPKSVISLLKKYGFDKTQLKEIISSAPHTLVQKVDRTLGPKIKYFIEDIKFPRSDFVKLVKKNPRVLYIGLDTCTIPTINYLKQILGDHDKVIQTVRDSSWVLSAPAALKRMQLNVTLFQNYGIADDMLKEFICRNPRHFVQRPERIQDAINRVDKELGIPRDSPRAFRGICVLAAVSKETLEMKYKLFKSYGWTDLEIRNMGRIQPYGLTMSEEKIRNALDFLMTELGYTPTYLATHPTFMMYSMEKRVKPRYQVLKVLKENGLIEDKRGCALYSISGVSDSTFLNKYVLPYEDKLPNLYEIYSKSLSQ